MLADFHFIRPFWLLALVPAIVFIVLSLKHKLAQGNWDKVCDSELLPYILQDKAGRQQHWTLAIIAIASILTILALAGPTWEQLPSPVFRNDAAVVIALDLSRSMDATDIKPSRLKRAHFKIADLLTQRKDGLTALIVYASDAFTVTPLTEDIHTINSQLKALNTDIMPSQGSNVLAALDLAVELLQQAGQTQGAILLISDGIHDDVTKKATALLGDYQLSVLGVGTPDGAPITLNNGSFLKDRSGNIVVPKLNAAALTDLADSNNGIYQTIKADDSDIAAFVNKMDNPNSQNTTNEEQQHLIEKWDEKGPWLLLFILPLAALYFRKGLLVVSVVILLPFPQDSYAIGWQDLWLTQDQQAQQAFEQQQFEQAGQQFQSPEWKAAAQYKAGNYQQAIETLSSLNTANSFYNQANALAKSQQLPKAVAAYDQALKLDPEHEDAKFNKDLVEQALKQQQNQQQNSDQPSEQDEQQSPDQQEQSQQQNEKSNSSEQQGESDQENEASEQQNDAEENSTSEAQQNENKDAEKHDSEMQQQADTTQKQMTENEQANAQWLQRIPDDPAGLLKRKFKYQYGQRKNKTQQEQSW
jgi:Ca-activated chloride channel homolog